MPNSPRQRALGPAAPAAAADRAASARPGAGHTGRVGLLAALLTGAAILSGCAGSGSTAGGSPTSAAGGLPTSATTAAAPGGGYPGSTSSAAPPQAGSDPCALVTQQEASTAFGAPASAPQAAAATGLAGGKACSYFAHQEQDSLLVGLLTNAGPGQLNAVKGTVQLPGATFHSLAGIGDAADILGVGPVAIVIFQKGSNLVLINMNLLGQNAPTTAATTVAQDAAGRL